MIIFVAEVSTCFQIISNIFKCLLRVFQLFLMFGRAEWIWVDLGRPGWELHKNADIMRPSLRILYKNADILRSSLGYYVKIQTLRRQALGSQITDLRVHVSRLVG